MPCKSRSSRYHSIGLTSLHNNLEWTTRIEITGRQSMYDRMGENSYYLMQGSNH